MASSSSQRESLVSNRFDLFDILSTYITDESAVSDYIPGTIDTELNLPVSKMCANDMDADMINLYLEDVKEENRTTSISNVSIYSSEVFENTPVLRPDVNEIKVEIPDLAAFSLNPSTPVVPKTEIIKKEIRLSEKQMKKLDIAELDACGIPIRLPVSPALSGSIDDPIVPYRIKIIRYQRNEMELSKSYIEFVIEIDNGPLKWRVFRRFSEFEELHAKLKELNFKRPKLPPKYFGKHTHELLEQRRKMLQDYMWELLKTFNIATSVPMMIFLGLLQGDMLNKNPDDASVISRMYLEDAIKLMDAGDVVLIRSDSFLSSVQRKLTSSRYDHVGIIVRFPIYGTSIDSLYLLEATGDGVHTYNLGRRLIAWATYAPRVAFRRLNFHRSAQRMNKLLHFVEKVDGYKYGLNTLNFIRRKSVDAASRNSFFCSELVACAYKAMSILPDDRPSNGYLPASFSQGSQDLHLISAVLGEEILVDFPKQELSAAIFNGL